MSTVITDQDPDAEELGKPAGPDRTWLYGPAAMAIFLVAWEAWAYFANIPELYLPRPSVVIATLVDLFLHKRLAYDLALTLYRIFAGFFLAAIAGVAIGVAMGMSKRLYAVCDIFVAAIYPIPKISLVPLLIIWLGSGNIFQIVLSALGCVFPILINTVQGVRQCDEGLVLAARDLGANRRQVQWKVVLPAAVPSIFSGLRLALGISIILVVAAEMQTSRYGLGGRLNLAGQILETGQVFAILLLLAFLGVLFTKAQQSLDHLVNRWRVR